MLKIPDNTVTHAYKCPEGSTGGVNDEEQMCVCGGEGGRGCVLWP